MERAGNWFLHSGIQERNGGVARYYRSDLKQNARVSTEITGYTVSALLYLHQRLGDSAYREAALRAASFLTRKAWSESLGTFPFEHSDNGNQPRALAYFFDSGIIVRGLLAAWRAAGDQEFLHAAVNAGASMLSDFGGPRRIHPILELPAKTALPHEPRWSAQPGCYQLKAAMAWYDLAKATGDPAFCRAYEHALDEALANQAAFLPGEADRFKVMDRLHAYAYFLEGALPRADRPACADAIRSGIARMEECLNEIAPVFVRSDVYAQLLRARLYADQFGILPLDRERASHEAERAAAFALASDDPRIDGGFAFGKKCGQRLPFVNPVSTAFCAQAIGMWRDYEEGEREFPVEALI